MYKLMLAWRYFWRRPICWTTVAAVGLCVFIVTVVMAVINGLVGDFREKNHEYVGDCVVISDSLTGFVYYEEFMDKLRDSGTAEAVSGVIRSYGLMTQVGADRSIGVEIVGIDPVAHSAVTNFEQTIHYNRGNVSRVFDPKEGFAESGVVIGIDMLPQRRDSQGAYYHPASPVRYELIISTFPLTAKGALAKAGTDVVNTKRFVFSDSSESGLVKADARSIYMDFDEAQRMCGMAEGEKRVNVIHVRFAEGVGYRQGVETVREMWEAFAAEKMEQGRYQELLEQVYVSGWVEYRRATLASMEKEQIMLSALFLMLGLITVFIVYVVFYMIVGSKSRDIGILMSMGASGWDIGQIFLLFSVFIGVLGGGIGLLLGVGFLSRVNELEGLLFEKYGWQLWDRSIYAIGEIPSEVGMDVFLTVGLAAVAACVLGALGPSLKVARMPCAQSLAVNQV